jgi:hypothetical protein
MFSTQFILNSRSNEPYITIKPVGVYYKESLLQK